MAYLGLLAQPYTRIATSAIMDGFMTDVKVKTKVLLSWCKSLNTLDMSIDKIIKMDVCPKFKLFSLTAGGTPEGSRG